MSIDHNSLWQNFPLNHNRSNFIKMTIDEDVNLWMNTSMKLCSSSLQHSFDFSLDEVKLDKFSEIFSLIDLSHFLLKLIKAESDIILNTSKLEFKSAINFHKVKEIDLIKLLVMVREKIDHDGKNFLISDSCFFKEVSVRLEELDEILKNSFFLRVNDVEVNDDYEIYPELINSILDDCNCDLLELDVVISKLFQEWKIKQHQGHLSKGRIERISEKIIDLLHNDVAKNLQLICIILDRLFYGYSTKIINIPYFKSVQDFLLKFRIGIDEKQYQSIVDLKHFHYKLEQKTLTKILEVTESQVKLNEVSSTQINRIETFNSYLSPIKTISKPEKKSLMFTSTPYFSNHIHKTGDRITTTYFDESISENDDDEGSIPSTDSGILPITENDVSLATSRDTVDILPFPDEEYEKIGDFEISDFSKSVPILFDDSDCFESISTYSEKEEQYCSNSKDVSFKNGNKFNEFKEFEHFANVINSLQLSRKEKENMYKKINVVLSCEELNVKFDWALRLTVFREKDNSVQDRLETLTQLERIFFGFMQMTIRVVPLKCNWNINLDAQNNNSACSTNHMGNFISDFNDQNTNNNADIKDEESTDLMMCSKDTLNSDVINEDNNFQLSFINESADFSSSEVIVKEDHTREDCTVDWHQYDNLMEAKSGLVDENLAEGSLILEDIDLALRLSELHLQNEFEAERNYDAAIIKSKNEIVKKYQYVKKKVLTKLLEFGNNDPDSETYSSEELKEENNDNNSICTDNEEQLGNTIEDIEEELKTEFCSEVLSNNSINDFGSNNTSIIEDTKSLESIPHDSDLLSLPGRIVLTISLTDKLLTMTKSRLNLISSVFKSKENLPGRKTVSTKILSIYSLRQRLFSINKIMSNLKYSIKCSYQSEESVDFISQINDLVSGCNILSKFSYDLEEWINKTNRSKDDTNTNSEYLHELPNDLLVTMDNVNLESLVSVSVQRLHVTIAALAYYPCYDTLMKSSFKKLLVPFNLFISTKSDRKLPLTNSELMCEIRKLRRITAICALNIVDLHVITAKLELHYQKSDSNAKLDDLKELLLLWGTVDKECHRLLRCTSLIQHVLMDTRRTYVELVSLTAIVRSIMRTVALSSNEIETLNVHMDNIHNYKLKIIEWLEEVEICSYVVHKKRITNTRFKCYEDIHDYLEENLNSISELSGNIKIGCQNAVSSLSAILTYCSDLSKTSMTSVDIALNTNANIDNMYLCTSTYDQNHTNNAVIGALVKLEELTTRLNHVLADKEIEKKISLFQDLLDQSKDLLLIILEDANECISKEENVVVIVNDDFEEDDHYDSLETNIVEDAIRSLTEKISEIATYAASNALMVFLENNNEEEMTDIDTDQQISSWSTISKYDHKMKKVMERIVDDISAMMTASLLQNILVTDVEHMNVSCKLIFENICHHLGDKTLHFLVECVFQDSQRIDDTTNDITEYFSEELSHLMVKDSIQSLSVAEPKSKRTSFITKCVSKLQQKMCKRLFEKSVSFIANFASIYVDASIYSFDLSEVQKSQKYVTEQINDLPSPIPTYRLSKKIHQEFFNGNHVLAKISKIMRTDVFSLNNYQYDVRKSKFCVQKPKMRNEKVSKLVAHFEKDTLREEVTERICLNSVQVKVNEAIKELIHDVVEDIPIYEKAIDDVSSWQNDSDISFNSISMKFTNSSQNENVRYLSETCNCVCNLEEIIPLYGKRKCLQELNVNTKNSHSCSLTQPTLALLPERIFSQTKLDDVSCNKEIVPNVNVKVCTCLNGVMNSVDKYSCLHCSNYSSVLNNYGKSQSFEEEVISTSFNIGTNDYIVIDSLESFTNINENEKEENVFDEDLETFMVVNNSPEVLRKVLRDTSIHEELTILQSRVRTCDITEVEEGETALTCLGPPFHQNFICDSQNTRNVIEKDILHRNTAPLLTTEIHNIANTGYHFENSLSRLWLFICVLTLILIFLTFSYDHINHICYCIRNGNFLVPKLVSSGLPF